MSRTGTYTAGHTWGPLPKNLKRGDWVSYWTRKRGGPSINRAAIVQSVSADGQTARVRCVDHGGPVSVFTIETKRLKKMKRDRG